MKSQRQSSSFTITEGQFAFIVICMLITVVSVFALGHWHGVDASNQEHDVTIVMKYPVRGLCEPDSMLGFHVDVELLGERRHYYP